MNGFQNMNISNSSNMKYGVVNNKGQYIRLNPSNKNNNYIENKQRYSTKNNLLLFNKEKNFSNNNFYQNKNTNYTQYINGDIENNEKFIQIKHDIQKLNNKIKRLNNLVNTNNEKVIKSKDNSHFSYSKRYNNLNDINNVNINKSNYTNYEKRDKIKKINKFNNNYNNYYQTYDLTKVKFENENNNVNSRKLSQNTRGQINLEMLSNINNNKKGKSYAFSNKSDYDNTFDLSNNEANYKSYKSNKCPNLILQSIYELLNNI